MEIAGEALCLAWAELSGREPEVTHRSPGSWAAAKSTQSLGLEALKMELWLYSCYFSKWWVLSAKQGPRSVTCYGSPRPPSRLTFPVPFWLGVDTQWGQLSPWCSHLTGNLWGRIFSCEFPRWLWVDGGQRSRTLKSADAGPPALPGNGILGSLCACVCAVPPYVPLKSGLDHLQTQILGLGL